MSTDVRSARDFDEEGFHEIQLSGKQLVFLCMATTVVSIVIFLCGVLVGRGVRPVETIAEAASPSVTADAPAAEPAAPPPAALPAVPGKPATANSATRSAAATPAPPPAAAASRAVEEPRPVPDS